MAEVDEQIKAMGADPTTFRLSDFTLVEGPTANQAELVEGQWNIVYEHVVKKGEAWLFGRGRTENPNEAEGFVYGRFDDATGSQINNGRWRIGVRTLSDAPIEALHPATSFDVTETDSGRSDRASRREFAIATWRDGEPNFIGRDHKITIEVRPGVGSGFSEVDDTDGDTELLAEGYVWEER